MEIKTSAEKWWLFKYKPKLFKENNNRELHKRLVFVTYRGVIHETFAQLKKYDWHCSGQHKNIRKHDVLLVARGCDMEVVKPCYQWRKAVKSLGLSAEVGLAKELDCDKLIEPYIFKEKPVRVVLRNGLVVSCKLIVQDDWNLVARCKGTDAEEDNVAFVLIPKHGVYDVESCE